MCLCVNVVKCPHTCLYVNAFRKKRGIELSFLKDREDYRKRAREIKDIMAAMIFGVFINVRGRYERSRFEEV